MSRDDLDDGRVPRRRVRPRALAAGALLALAAGFSIALAPDGSRTGAPSEEIGASLLAIGDTGVPPTWLSRLGGQRAVGASLAREDARARVDALLLLGDNFYENGLRASELVERVRENVVGPYCRFVDLSAPRSGEVAGGCAPDEAREPAPRLLAVLGNHDVATLESPALQAQQVDDLVANWDLSAEPARWVALSPELSLVLFDSNHLRGSEDRGPLRAALRESPGPWRILAAHHAAGTRGEPTDERYESLVRLAVREAEVPVHLMLAGHEHNLQVIALDDPGPRLVVVSGAGASPRPVASESRGRVFSHEGLGFARVDLVRAGGEESLRVTLFATWRWASLLGLAPEPLGRWTVLADGSLRIESGLDAP